MSELEQGYVFALDQMQDFLDTLVGYGDIVNTKSRYATAVSSWLKLLREDDEFRMALITDSSKALADFNISIDSSGRIFREEKEG